MQGSVRNPSLPRWSLQIAMFSSSTKNKEYFAGATPTGVAFSSRKIAKCNLHRLLCFLVRLKIKSMFSCSTKNKEYFAGAKCNLYRLLCFLVRLKIKSMFSCSTKNKEYILSE